MERKLTEEIRALVERSKFVFVASVNENGEPNIKVMFAKDRDKMGVYYMSTNYSSKRVQQFQQNPKACIYFCDEKNFQGLRLNGNMEACTDRTNRERLWEERDIMYYPQGVDDPDYCVLKFTAQRGNYYHGLRNVDFQIGELEEGGTGV